MEAGALGFVAAGLDRRGQQALPAVWTSADGLSWSRVSAGPASPFLDGQVVLGVAVGAAGAVAVGTLRTGAETDAMAWFSPDGITWRTVPLGLAGFTGPADQAARSVTATSDGFVAVGDDARGDRRVAVVWTSTDGITWQRQPPSPDMAELPGGDSTQGVSAADVAGTGPVVAVGGGFAMQVWTSPDGRRWTREQPPVQDVGSDPTGVATDGRSLLVVVGRSSLWSRAAGGAWAGVSADPAIFPRQSRTISIGRVVAVGDRIVAFGSTRDASGRDGAAVWISTDRGRSWARQDTRGAFGDGSVQSLAAAGTMLVAVGTTSGPAGQGGSVAAAWISADQGSTWQRVDAANPAFAIRHTTQFFGVTGGGPGFVAVGLDFEFRQTIQAHAWYSSDGRTWTRAAEPAEWSGPGDHLLDVACPLPGGGIVALGITTVRGEQDVWAWVSSDGATWEQATGPGAMVLGGAGAQYPQACASTPTGVLVAGSSAGDSVLWATTDGRVWTTVGGPTTFAAPGRDGLTGIAVDGARRVVTGYDGDDLVVFTSADAGATWARRTASSFGGFGRQVGSPVLMGDEAVVAGEDAPGAGIWIGPAP